MTAIGLFAPRSLSKLVPNAAEISEIYREPLYKQVENEKTILAEAKRDEFLDLLKDIKYVKWWNLAQRKHTPMPENGMQYIIVLIDGTVIRIDSVSYFCSNGNSKKAVTFSRVARGDFDKIDILFD
jgi:hypothetical protein